MAAGDLCTLPALKARLGIDDSAADAVLAALITAVSGEISDYTARQFVATTQTQYYTATQPDRLLIDDCLAISNLATDDGTRTYPFAWAPSEYDLGPAGAPFAVPAGPYWEVTLPPFAVRWFWPGLPRGVRITGSFGFGLTVPAPVAEACLLQCELAWRATNAPSGTSGGGDFGAPVTTPAPGGGLHPFTRRMLDPYRRIDVG